MTYYPYYDNNIYTTTSFWLVVDREILEQYLTEMSIDIKIMKENLDDIDVLKFYIGKISLANKAITAMLIKAK